MNYPQQPPQPYYPQQPPPAQYPPAAYGPPPQAPYPAQQGQQWQQIPQPYPVAPPVQLAQGTIDDFYSQPSGGSGKPISWEGKQIGFEVIGRIARAVTKGDIQQQTNKQGQPQTFRDGRPKLVMKVPLDNVQTNPPTADYAPENTATWYVKGQSREELSRAMTDQGAPPNTAPQSGAWVRIRFVGTRPIPGMSPANQVQVDYTPAPADAQAGPAAGPQLQPAPPAAPAAPTQYPPQQPPPAQLPPAPVQQPPTPAPDPQYGYPQNPQWQPPQNGQPQQYAPPATQQPTFQPPVQQAPPAAAGPGQKPPEMTDEQWALFNNLSNATQPPA